MQAQPIEKCECRLIDEGYCIECGQPERDKHGDWGLLAAHYSYNKAKNRVKHFEKTLASVQCRRYCDTNTNELRAIEERILQKGLTNSSINIKQFRDVLKELKIKTIDVYWTF